MTATRPVSGWARVKPVVQVGSGNFLEMYDFFVFAYYAAAIGRAYFPSGDEVAGLLLSLATFGVGFLMRPVGAFVLGAYIDHHGRRAGLLLTLSLMSLGTLSVALTPDYSWVGLVAPIVVVLGRLVQGFSAGAELGGVSVYLSEIATPGHKGFYVAWQSASQQIAVIFAALLGVALQNGLSAEQMDRWGWRLPLLIGCLIAPFIFVLRRSLVETEEFEARERKTTSLGEVWRVMAANWHIVLIGMMLVIMTTVSFYLITAYTPTFGRETLKLSALSTLVVTLCVGISNLIWLPLSGAVSDRIGRRPLMIGCTMLALLTAYPAMTWLAAAPSFERLLLAELWLSFIYGVYNGAMVVHLTEIMPPVVKSAGFSMAYSLATTLGGFTPFICTYLIKITDNKAMPGLWLSFAALVGLAAVLLERRYATRADPLRSGLMSQPASL